jgi:hypothetical protein
MVRLSGVVVSCREQQVCSGSTNWYMNIVIYVLSLQPSKTSLRLRSTIERGARPAPALGDFAPESGHYDKSQQNGEMGLKLRRGV